MAQKIINWMKKPIVEIAIFVVVAVAMILVSFLVLHIPLVAVCTIVILEGALAALLNRIPIWIHGLIVIAQIVAGILFGKIVFMVLMAVVYVAAVALLYLWTSKDN
ncbi:MAG: hypothetical protein PUB24_06785 [Lachnospiraceae bacterium]|nr:hypothetical protein [Lachnospiraceae bacterium]MDD6192768.1 hypothetical protein [Lachnospiraceae bacterium]MDY4793595.1 hypothetical protein [Pararoseburia sp.]